MHAMMKEAPEEVDDDTNSVESEQLSEHLYLNLRDVEYREEFPLKPQKNTQPPKRRTNVAKGPLRVVRLCLLGILLPCCLAILILYLRYRVYIETLYPLAMSDMRLVDNRVSTTWCQGQSVKVNNATFNAFLLPGTPVLTTQTKPMSMVRHLVLEDDSKEYWGFYLLRGSVVTLSTCVRWPGASLIVIRGHKHLHECAYIGDNSSEELDEVLEALQDGTYVNVNTSDEAPSNTPNNMKRHRVDVEFHHPFHKNTSKTHTLDMGLDISDITDDPKQMKLLLQILKDKNSLKSLKNMLNSPKKQNQKQENSSNDVKPKQHVHRNSTIGKGENQNFKFITNATLVENITSQISNTHDEIASDILRKLKDLGEDGHMILQKINENYNKTNVPISKGRHYVKPSVDFDDNIDAGKRKKRELYISGMTSDLNQHDEENNQAVEEGFLPDGIADHHGAINETTLNDKSNSEFWSSFSSSEEALLNCSGLILNLPLTPHTECKQDFNEHQVENAYLTNTVTYKVPTNGYYFFVFNSENEIQPNYIRVRFHIQKTLYNVSNPVQACTNKTDSCQLDLHFFSNEKLVMELPISEDDNLWNEEFVVISQCQPRTALYVLCVIAVPILVILFAFQ